MTGALEKVGAPSRHRGPKLVLKASLAPDRPFLRPMSPIFRVPLHY
jgi:hypothetical protein